MVVSVPLFLIVPAIFSLNTLSVHFINVGQGDSILIQTPQKRNILIDGGGIPYGDFDIGKKVVLPYLWRLGIRSIDMMVLTHPDLDHLKGLIAVLKEMKVNMVIDSGIEAQCAIYNQFLSLIRGDDNITYYKPATGDTIRLAPDLEIVVLNSLNPAVYGKESNFNNHSIVLKLLYKNTSFLFTGDIEEKAEMNLLNWAHLLKSDILKVAHHGSITSSNDCFIEKVQPELAVISVGLNNFNHPPQDILERLDCCCQRVFRTDCNGTVLINSNGQKYNIKTLR
jgi:competence protein ComEC